jgi:hypothetical protein
MAKSSAEPSASMLSAAYGAAVALSAQRKAAAEAPGESGVAAAAVPQASMVVEAARQPAAALRALAAGRRLAAGQDAVRAALPSVELWAFRRGRLRPAPAQRRLTRYAPAKARSRIASPSGRLW